MSQEQSVWRLSELGKGPTALKLHREPVGSPGPGSASCLLPPLPGLFPRVHYAYRLIDRGDHPTPVLGRHPCSYPFHVQRLHPRKGLFGIHLDTALLAFAHLGARHDTPPQSSFGWGRLRPTTLARFGARRVSLSGRGLAGRDSYPPLCAARRAARLSHAGARESVHASSTRGTRTPYTPLSAAWLGTRRPGTRPPPTFP